MNGQIVLCRGVNDGAELDRSIRDLTKYIPAMQSVSVVPVGLSKYRDGLYPLEPFTPEQLGDTIDLIEKWQKKIYAEHGIHFIHIAIIAIRFRKRIAMMAISSWKMGSA